MKKLKIVAVCGFGVGSSVILKMTIEKMLSEEGVAADVEPQDITSLGGINTDIVFTSSELSGRVGEIVCCPVVAIDNFIDVNEVKEKGLGLIRELSL